MQYRNLPYVKKPVSRILFGTTMAPFSTGGDGNALLDSMYDLGINTFDAARNYGLAELSLGNWIEAKGHRENIVILSKCGHPSLFGRKRVNEAEMRKDLKKSLSYLRTDYIDIYMLHRDDLAVDPGEIVEIFNAMHAERKIGAFGGSNWTHERIEAANEYAYKHSLIPFSISSPNFGLAEQVEDPWGGGCVTISGPANESAREWYRGNQMPVVAYSSLGRGFFSGRLKSGDEKHADQILDSAAMRGYGYPVNFERLRRCEALAKKKGATVAQIALAWLFGQNMNTFAIVSTSGTDRMKENIKALDIELKEDEIKYLDLKGRMEL